MRLELVMFLTALRGTHGLNPAYETDRREIQRLADFIVESCPSDDVRKVADRMKAITTSAELERFSDELLKQTEEEGRRDAERILGLRKDDPDS